MRRRRTSLMRTRPFTPPGVTEGETVFVTCGFCRGRGLYPFGHPPSSANCAICSGQGKVRVVTPYLTCAACQGTGTVPGKAMSCTSCQGRGVLTARNT